MCPCPARHRANPHCLRPRAPSGHPVRGLTTVVMEHRTGPRDVTRRYTADFKSLRPRRTQLRPRELDLLLDAAKR